MTDDHLIVNTEQRRALEFIATANRGGARPRACEINEWRLQPDPKPARQGKLLEPAVLAVPDQRVRTGGPTAIEQMMKNVLGTDQSGISNLLSASVQKQLANLNTSQLMGLNLSAIGAIKGAITAGMIGEYKTIPGKPGRAAVYAPHRPSEKFLAHLRRLGWVERDQRGRYGVTQLGHALLRAEVSVDSENGEPSVVVLEADDELAYGQMLGVIAECGDALILDAYLGTQELMHILQHTKACRFIVGSKLSPKRVVELSILIETTLPYSDGRARELRRADFHDRWLIGDQDVYGLGSSLNGVGKKATTTLVRMPEITAQTMRSHAEDLWREAEFIARTRQVNDSGEKSDEGDDASGDVPDDEIHEVNGAFKHGTCKVRHRSTASAEQCIKSA